jgi:hypothetical protein
MEAHADFLHRLRERVPHLHLAHRQVTSRWRLARVGLTAGIVGGLVMGVPLIVYDWVRDSHSALEFPMAVTGWLFGLDHFAPNDYRWWPIVIGALFALVYWGAFGLAFAALADRVYRVSRLAGGLALGAAWSFVSFVFFWYMVLPIARDGAPFRPTAVAEFVAPNWVWIVGFTAYGLVTGICYWALRRREAREEAPAASAQPEQRAA